MRLSLAIGLSLTAIDAAPSAPGGAYTAQGVTLDGLTSLRTESLTAPADNGLCSYVFWFKKPVPDTNVLWVVDPNGSYPSNAYWSDDAGDHSANTMHQQFCNSDDSACWNADPNNDVLIPADSAWRCALVSVDTNHNNPGKIFNVYVGDVSLPYDLTSNGLTTAFFPNFNGYALYVFDDGFGDGLECDIADFWMAPGQYIDFTVEANRRKFIDADGKPVSLGADGSTPTGTAPAVFFSGNAATFGTNKGTGGVFTTTGAFTDASTSPSD